MQIPKCTRSWLIFTEIQVSRASLNILIESQWRKVAKDESTPPEQQQSQQLAIIRMNNESN